MAPLVLTSPENPRVKALMKLRKSRDRRESGLFVAEGVREISRAIGGGLELLEFYHCPEAMKLLPVELEKGVAAGRRFEITGALLQKMSYNENPQGVLAVFRGRVLGFEDLGAGDGNPLYLVMVAGNKPGNLGAVARSAAAGGAAALLTADSEVDVYNPNAIRASTGAVFELPVVAGTSHDVLKFLAQRKVRIFAAMPEAKVDYVTADFTGATAIVIGSEHAGLGGEWERAGTAIGIPMRGGVVDSLNASTAAAVLLFEALRQRRQRVSNSRR